jgi:hypothetical protein
MNTQLFKKLESIAFERNATLVIYRDLAYSGSAEAKRRTISISIKLGRQEFINTFFHELQHIINYDEHKYPAYHGRFSRAKQIRAAKTHGIQAERYTDRRAKKLQKKYFPQVPYKSAYKSKESVIFYKEYLNTWSD